MDQQTQQPAGPGSNTARNFAMFCHLAALACFIGIPFGNIIGPLIVWLIKKDEFPEVDAAGKEALNFQITMTIAAAVAFILVFVLIGFLLLAVVGIFDLVMVIIAAVKTSKGEDYRYPLCLRLIK